MKKIKVVFGVNDFLVGGMQRQIAEQLRHYDRSRFEFHLITLFDFPGKRTLYSELPADLHVHRLEFTGIADVLRWIQLYRLLKEIRPDIVVSSLFFGNFIFRMLRFFVGYACIAREHNTYVDKPLWQRVSDRLLAPVSFCIVAVSTTVADFTAKQEGIRRDRFRVIRNGIDIPAIRIRRDALPAQDELKSGMGFVLSDKILLNAARLTAQKNHKLLIEGFLLFRESHPEYKLVIVGEGKLYAALAQQIAAANAGDAVRLLGHKDDVWRFYKLSDAFVSASRIEGLSNAYLEALAFGLPLIATKTAGTDELIRPSENGFFIEAATPQCVAETLEEYAGRDTIALRQSAVETAQRFDIRRTVAEYECLFEEAIRSK